PTNYSTTSRERGDVEKQPNLMQIHTPTMSPTTTAAEAPHTEPPRRDGTALSAPAPYERRHCMIQNSEVFLPLEKSPRGRVSFSLPVPVANEWANATHPVAHLLTSFKDGKEKESQYAHHDLNFHFGEKASSPLYTVYVKPMEGGNGQGGKGQKQPPGSDHVSLTGRQGVEVIEGHTGQMTDRGTSGKVKIFADAQLASQRDKAGVRSRGSSSSLLCMHRHYDHEGNITVASKGNQKLGVGVDSVAWVWAASQSWINPAKVGYRFQTNNYGDVGGIHLFPYIYRKAASRR
ncbi:hypothetical protein JOQ06_010233, partial [Pogonophryne albipinna]